MSQRFVRLSVLWLVCQGQLASGVLFLTIGVGGQVFFVFSKIYLVVGVSPETNLCPSVGEIRWHLNLS